MRSGPRSTLSSLASSFASTFPSTFVVAVLVITGTIVPRVAADGIDDQKARVQQIADQLDALENRIGQLDEDHAAALDRIDALNVEIAEAQAHIDAQNVVLAELQGKLTSIAVDRFTSGGSESLTPLFSTAAQYSEDLQRQELSRAALNQGTGTSDELVDLLSSLADEQAALEAKKAEQASLAQVLEDKQAQGEALTQQYEDQYAAAKAELGDLIQQEQERRAAEAVAQAQAAQERANAAAAAKAAAQPRGGGASPAGGSGGSGGSSSNGGSGSGSSNGGSASGAATGGGGGASGGDASGGDASGSGSGSSGDSGDSSGGASAPPPASTASIAVNAAYSQLGVPYKFAAESPGVAFDCSGLTKWAWGQAGVYLPHQSGAQYASTPHITQEEAQPGDLIFYKSPIGHVAIYIGGGQMIHAPATGDVVKIAVVNWSRVVGVSRPG